MRMSERRLLCVLENLEKKQKPALETRESVFLSPNESSCARSAIFAGAAAGYYHMPSIQRNKPIGDCEDSGSRVRTDGGCAVREVRRVRTLFQFPMPDETSLARFYPSDYHSMTHAGS